MMRPLFAFLGAVVLCLLWLGLVVYQTGGDLAAGLASLGDSAQRAHLPGLAAKLYLQASVQERHRLQGADRASAAGKLLVQRIISHRMAAARTLLQAGYVEAAERIALEGARANYDDLQARALLLEIRLQGRDPDAARRELMLMVLKQEDPQLLCLLGQAFAAERREADAESFYRRALSRDGGHLPSLLGMARLAAARGDRQALNDWLRQAAQGAERPDEKRAVARLTPPAADPWQRAWGTVATLGRERGGALLLALAYIVFLFVPSLYGLFGRWRGAGAAPQGPVACAISNL